jgi:ubiquinone/menaquinone biosynthesis C-methylase UbiE
MSAATIQEEVRRFYDSIGWKQIGQDLFQNARYEDLRPVSREYLHRCHLRVGEKLPRSGRYLLDVGSGPIQYPEYLTYSASYEYRVCLDLSHRALVEARKRIGRHGLFVVGDAARLPFRSAAVEGLVSLHTVHHLPPGQQETAYREFYRTLRPGGSAATVYSWGDQSAMTRIFSPFIRAAFWGIRLYRRLLGKPLRAEIELEASRRSAKELLDSSGTFTHKHTYGWMMTTLGDLPEFEITVWRSVSTQFLRAFIHQPFLGKFWLRLIYRLEQQLPRWFGRMGQYPLVSFSRPELKPEG